MSTLEPEDLVLVAVLRDQRDLEIARVLGWYRIPLKTAPKMVRVDWIAFYLTGTFGDEKWSVRYLARVRGHELLTREDLLHDQGDHPSAQEPYFKILLGPLRTLARPIPARRWRRVSFLYTTGERLLVANDVKDLTLKGNHARLLRALDPKYEG